VKLLASEEELCSKKFVSWW